MEENFLNFEKSVNIIFKDKNLLKEAFTHRSYLNENQSWDLPHNERLEFLGDAVLELVVSENLFIEYPKHDEGLLTSIRAALVNYVALSKVAKEIGMEKHILMSKGEAKDNGRARDVILANAFEALVGAIYLDAGYRPVSDFIKKYVFVNVKEILEKNLYKDSKSLFQEVAQEKFKITPTYRVIEEYGPDHNKIFRVGIFLNEEKVGEGEGYSKQEAETEAAKKALYALKTAGN